MQPFSRRSVISVPLGTRPVLDSIDSGSLHRVNDHDYAPAARRSVADAFCSGGGTGCHARRLDCFDPAKLAVCREAEARGLNDGAAYPIPDLMIEVDISPPRIDRSKIYSKLRPPEVWKFSDDAASIEQLDASGHYAAADASRFLFVRAEEVTHWLRNGKSVARPAWKRAIREWASALLRPRAGI